MTTTPTPASQPLTPESDAQPSMLEQTAILGSENDCRDLLLKLDREQPSPARSDKDAERASFDDLQTYPSPHGTLVRLADVKCRVWQADRAAQESAPSSVEIATWDARQRASEYGRNAESCMLDEIADLRAALARSATAGTTAAPSEPDAYMAVMPTGEPVALHFQRILAESRVKGWGSGEVVPLYRGATAGNAAPTEAVYQVELDEKQGTWLDVDAADVETWRRKKFNVRVLASPAATAAPGDLRGRLMEMSEILREGGKWDGNEFVYADKSESDISMLDDLLTDVLRLASDTRNEVTGDLTKLVRYETFEGDDGDEFRVEREGEWVRFDDVRLILASNAGAAPEVPTPCDSTIHKNGAVVAVLDAGMLAMEGLVKEANRSEGGMDWHYFGGRAVVKTLGHVPAARAALERAMPRFLDAAPSNPPSGAIQEKNK